MKYMDLKKDLIEIVKKELVYNRVEFSEEWDDHTILTTYLEVRQRMFDSSIPYRVVFSDVLLHKIPYLDVAEQEALTDIIKRLEKCETLEPYMSKLIHKTDMPNTDFLLKNWGIYHLHLEKIEGIKTKFTMPNLLFFQVKGQIVHFIDVKPHPKGHTWFDRKLLEIIYSTWPWLLVYLKDVKLLNEIPDNIIHTATKNMGIGVNIKGNVVIPSNLGVMTSGNSTKAVLETNKIFNAITKSEIYIKDHEAEIKKAIMKETGVKIKGELDFELRIEEGYAIAFEKESGFKLKLPFKIGFLKSTQ